MCTIEGTKICFIFSDFFAGGITLIWFDLWLLFDEREHRKNRGKILTEEGKNWTPSGIQLQNRVFAHFHKYNSKEQRNIILIEACIAWKMFEAKQNMPH